VEREKVWNVRTEKGECSRPCCRGCSCLPTFFSLPAAPVRVGAGARESVCQTYPLYCTGARGWTFFFPSVFFFWKLLN
jgi:hypothetical protein